MIEFIKEYGITTIDYEYIVHNLSRDIVQNIALSENTVREILDFYNDLGITKTLGNIIIKRPDLILTSKDNLIDTISKIDLEVFKKVVEKSVDDLILLGI